MSTENSDFHYFETHDVAGKVVTRSLGIPLSRYQIEDRKEDKMLFKEVTVPVHDRAHLYLVRALRHDIPTSKEDKEKNPMLTIGVVGGGTSEALGNVYVCARIENAIRDMENFPSDVRVILLPHLASSARTKGKKEATRQPTFTDSARILNKALEEPELGVTKNLGLIGYSAGGTQVTEMAGLEDDIKFIAICEPGGHARHPKIAFQLLGAVSAVYKKYRRKGLGKAKAAYATQREIGQWWVSPKGTAGSVPGVIKYAISPPEKKVVEKLADAYCFGDEQAGLRSILGLLKPLTHDSTEKARQNIKAKVIFSPVTYAKALSIILDKLREYYPSVEAIKSSRMERDGEKKFREKVRGMLGKMFPQSQEVRFLPYDDPSHLSVVTEQDYWNQLMKEIATTVSS
jgi:hypothetical protein